MITDEELGKKLMVLNLIWCAILISLVVYLFVGQFVAPDIHTGVNENTMGMLRTALYVLAIIAFMAPKYIKKLMLSAKGGTGSLENDQNSAIQKYAVTMIVAWAISESIGIFGLVLYLLGKNEADLYFLIGVSAAALFVYRPGREELNDFVRSYSSKTTGSNPQ